MHMERDDFSKMNLRCSCIRYMIVKIYVVNTVIIIGVFVFYTMLAQLQTRVEQHPDELVDVFRDLSNAYHSTKELKHKDTKLSLHTLDSIMHKVHCLQRLPSESVPLSYDLWSKHLARIYNCCYNDRQTIQNEHTKWTRMEAPTSTPTSNIPAQQNTNTNELQPWITDWSDETLQSPAVLQIVKRVVMPILFPNTKTSTMKLPPTHVVEGPAYPGKSHLLHTIRTYLKQHTTTAVTYTHLTLPTKRKV